MAKGPRSQLKGTPTGKICDHLNIRKLIVTDCKYQTNNNPRVHSGIQNGRGKTLCGMLFGNREIKY